MSKPSTLLSLSPGRQALVRLCQSINFGSIENLAIERGEPMFGPRTVVVQDVKLDSDEVGPTEIDLADFTLSREVTRLMEFLDRGDSQTFRRIDIRAGIPRRVLLESGILPLSERGRHNG